jgi:hypothetical protein
MTHLVVRILIGLDLLSLMAAVQPYQESLLLGRVFPRSEGWGVVPLF